MGKGAEGKEVNLLFVSNEIILAELYGKSSHWWYFDIKKRMGCCVCVCVQNLSVLRGSASGCL